MRVPRRLVAAAAVALAATCVQAPAGAAGCTRVRGDGWTELDPPSFGDGPTKILDYAVEPSAPERIWLTNGKQVHLTTDSGCTWELVYQAGIEVLPPQEPLGPVTLDLITDVIAIGMSRTTTAGEQVYLLLRDTVPADQVSGVVRRPRVVVSRDRGTTWTDAATGLPPLGDPVSISVAPSDADQLYLLVTDASGAVRRYRTTDGGAAWEARGDPTGAPPAVREIVVDPTDPTAVWALGDALYRSADAAATLSRVDNLPPGSAVMAVGTEFDVVAERIQVVAASRDGYAHVSTDGGRTWKSQAGAPYADGVAVAPQGLRYAVTAPDRTVVVTGGAPGVITPRTPIREPRFARAPGNRLFALTETLVLYRDISDRERPPPPPSKQNIELYPPKLRKPGEAFLTPIAHRVDLAPDATGTVPYTLDLPRTPTPLDVMLVFDSTSSMDPLFYGLRNGIQQIVNDLGKMQVDAWFGLADFKEYPTHPNAVPFDYPYLRRRPVGPVDERLETAIEDVQPSDGTTDCRTSALEAAFQAGTGRGRAINDALADVGPYHIQPGQGAGFRQDALKLVLLATDIEMRKPGLTNPGYPGPSVAAVTAALNAEDVGLVGISLENEACAGRGVPDAQADLDALARGTGTLAPRIGADCNGDGKTDVAFGRPLVCRLPLSGAGTRLAQTIFGLLDAVQDIQPVTLEVVGPADVAAVLAPVRYEAIDVKKDNLLHWRVQVACPPTRQGQVVPMTVQARVRHKVVAKSKLEVGCALPPPPLPPPIAAQPPLTRAAVPPIPPPPPQPVPQTNPNPNPNPQVQPQIQPQPNLQAGLAQQEQEQLHLATVWIDQAGAGEEQVEFAATRRDEPDPALLLLAAATMACAAAGAVARARARVAVVAVRSRR